MRSSLPRGEAPWIACLLAALGVACGGEGDTRPAGEERFARRFLPFEASWRKESEIPDEPQETPKMVIWELSEFAPGTEPTPEQRATAQDLVARSYRAARDHGWYEFDQALADGFQILFGDRYHYANEEFLMDDRILDPERPEFLMYYGTPTGKKFAGFMFYVRRPEDRGPQIGGPLSVWHYHVWNEEKCLLGGLLGVGVADGWGRCERGVASSRSPEMLHVWLLDVPQGPFQTNMHIEPALLAELLEKRESSGLRLAPEAPPEG